ncbi:DSS1/SEM1 family-domain-containing protein [Geopyxis carbonaria]|nr:DSS1/SEM1 family-domain-containing protein [Geopyxis carbonaria]
MSSNVSSKVASAPESKLANKSKDEKKVPAPLEEDDEFEDFPAEDWSDTETDGNNGKIKHLWEESWDDDDTSDDFAAQLRYERNSRSRTESKSPCHSSRQWAIVILLRTEIQWLYTEI